MTNRKSRFGFLNFCKRSGSTYDGCSVFDNISELVDNSIDAKCNEIVIFIDENKKKMYYCDDGNGMDKDKFEKLLTPYSDNYNESEDINGKFGIGGNRAIFGLMNLGDHLNKKLKIYTKEKKGDLYSFDIDFNEIDTLEDYESINILKNDKQCQNKLDKFITENNMRTWKSGIFIELTLDETILNKILKSITISDIQNNICLYFINTYNYYLERGLKMFLNKQRIDNIDNDLINNISIIYPIDLYESSDNNIEFCTNYNNKYLSLYSDDRTRSGFANKFKDEKKNKFVKSYNKIGTINFKCSFDRDNIKTTQLGDYVPASKLPKYMLNLCEKYNIGLSEELEETSKVEYKFLSLNKDVKIIRGNRTIGYLEFNTHTTGSDGNIKKQRLNILKELRFNRNMDSILNLTQDNKSNVSWKNTLNGLKHYLSLLVDKFRNDVVVKYLKDTKEKQKYLLQLKNCKIRLPDIEYNENITEYSDLIDIKTETIKVKNIIKKQAQLQDITKLIEEGYSSKLKLTISSNDKDIENELEKLQKEKTNKLEKIEQEKIAQEKAEKVEQEKLDKQITEAVKQLEREQEVAKNAASIGNFVASRKVEEEKKEEIKSPQKEEIKSAQKEEIELSLKEEIKSPQKEEIKSAQKEEIKSPQKEEIELSQKEETQNILNNITGVLDYYKIRHPELIKDVEKIIKVVETDLNNLL
jgi:hypothetical protein